MVGHRRARKKKVLVVWMLSISTGLYPIMFVDSEQVLSVNPVCDVVVGINGRYNTLLGLRSLRRGSGRSGSGSGPSGSRQSIQPAPPRPLPMPLLVPAAHQSFGASAQLLLEAASSSASQQPQSPPPPPRPPARITRSASKRGRKDLDDPASDDHPSPSKRAKSNDSDRSPTRS